jgi:hypothetical protein
MPEQAKQEARRWWHELRALPPFPLATLVASAVILAIVSLTQSFLLGLIEIAFLVIGLAGSYTLGRHVEARPEIPVRGAFRRMARLYVELFGLRAYVTKEREASDSGALELIEFTLTNNLGTIEDAMEDWADLVPEEIEELRRRKQGEVGEFETLEGETL